MGPTHFYGARAEKSPKKADFAMKQTNICRLSGDITTLTATGDPFPGKNTIEVSQVIEDAVKRTNLHANRYV